METIVDQITNGRVIYREIVPIGDIPPLVSGGVHAQLTAGCFSAGTAAAGVGLPLFGIDAEHDDADSALLKGEHFLAESGATP